MLDGRLVGPGEAGSSGLQTIMRIGKSDMHELTNSAVEIALGVGGFGGSGSAMPGVAAPFGTGLSWGSC